ncbi:hypothetical protein [Streptomyces sp. enrichment culture]|uniref:hypothetical protein n=1 Tax=Streptomyces sp. enrichment culture TaxID=1795815 RepID=UPI003F551386
MPPLRRPSRALLTAAGVAVLAAVTGCGDAGALRGAGATPTAVGPTRLWPELPPASSPAFDFDEAETEVIKGVRVTDSVHDADPVAIVRAEIEGAPEEYAGARAKYHETAERMADCTAGAGKGRCPVLRPYYRDLTGDGRDELTLGFRQLPGTLTAVRVYTVERGRLVRVMHYEDALSGVELAGQSVIVRSPSEVAGYEYRLQWTWDPDQRAMLLTQDEMLRTGGRTAIPAPSRTAGPASSHTAVPAPSRTAGPASSHTAVPASSHTASPASSPPARTTGPASPSPSRSAAPR